MVKRLSPLFIFALCALSLTACNDTDSNDATKATQGAEEPNGLSKLLCKLPFTDDCKDNPTEQKVAEEKPQEKKPEKLVVYTSALGDVSVDITHSAPASVVSLNSSTIKAELSANIASMSVRVGDAVKKGDVLAKLNCSDAQAQLQQAQARITSAHAQLRASELELNRTKTLNQKRSISESILTQRQAAYDAARGDYQASLAARNLSRNQVKRCTLRAPYDAIVTHRIGQVGELATFGSPIVKLVSSKDAEVTADILPANANSLTEAGSVEFESRGDTHTVTLRHIVSAIDNSKRTQEARLTFNDANTAPLAGTPGRLVWKDANQGIPAPYITERNKTLGVFVVENGTAFFTPLPNAQAGRPTAVDWSNTVMIVTTGQHGLKDKQDISDLVKGK